MKTAVTFLLLGLGFLFVLGAVPNPPARDRNPQPVEPTIAGPEPLRTSLVLPDGKQVDIPFSHQISDGQEIQAVVGDNHLWRVKSVRYEIFPKYTARLIYVAEPTY